MLLVRTAMVLETATRHILSLDGQNLDAPLIENYLAQTAAVMFYSEMEERVSNVVRARMSNVQDVRINHFLTKVDSTAFKRVPKSEICKTAALFGPDCKAIITAAVSDAELSRYGNVIEARHHTSHGEGGSVTLSDVKLAMDVGEKLLAALQRAIA